MQVASVHASSAISASFCHITDVRVAEKEKRMLRLRQSLISSTE
jgi:hypothetical protein